jgi:CO dehydrogenase/acetyl-CoA synthase delta subunit
MISAKKSSEICNKKMLNRGRKREDVVNPRADAFGYGERFYRASAKIGRS